MTIVRRLLACCLAVLIAVPASYAQEHVITSSALNRAVQQRVAQERADRAVIIALLQRPEVRNVAARAGISLEKAKAGVAALRADELPTVAAHARQVQNDLSGGSTVVISTTTIIIVLLLIILIVVLAD